MVQRRDQKGEKRLKKGQKWFQKRIKWDQICSKNISIVFSKFFLSCFRLCLVNEQPREKFCATRLRNCTKKAFCCQLMDFPRINSKMFFSKLFPCTAAMVFFRFMPNLWEFDSNMSKWIFKIYFSYSMTVYPS